MNTIIRIAIAIFLVGAVIMGAVYFFVNPKMDIAFVFIVPFAVATFFFMLIGGLWAIDHPNS